MTRSMHYDGYRSFPNVAWRNALQELFEVRALNRLLSLPQGKRVLEVGCGRGVAIPPLSKACRPSWYVGLDMDPKLLSEGRKRLRALGTSAELCEGDVRDMPFADGSFDMIIDFGTCYHIRQPQRALREIQRVLREGGLFVHETPVSQLIAHPRRTRGQSLPWHYAPGLRSHRTAVFWSCRRKDV